MLTSCPDLVGRLVFKVSSTCCSWSPAYSTTSTQSSTRSSTPFSPGSTNTLVETFHVHHSDSLRRFRRGFSDIYTKCWNSQVQPWQRWGCTRINVMRQFVHQKFWSPIRKQGHRNPPWNDMWQKNCIKHCQRHNGPESWVHITSSTQILIKLQFWNLD